MARYNDGRRHPPPPPAARRPSPLRLTCELRAGAVSGKVSTKMAHEECKTFQFLLFSRCPGPTGQPIARPDVEAEVQGGAAQFAYGRNSSGRACRCADCHRMLAALFGDRACHRPSTSCAAGFSTGRAQFFPSYSPGGDWRGLHYPNGICLVNIGLVTDKSDMVGVMCHEVSHEYAGPHDVRFARYLQHHLTKVTEMLLSK
eukprot:3293406-Prymnesium_polylepis.1